MYYTREEVLYLTASDLLARIPIGLDQYDVPIMVRILRELTGGPTRALTQQHPQHLAFQPYSDSLDLIRDPGETIRLGDLEAIHDSIHAALVGYPMRPRYRRSLLNWMGHELTITKIGLLPEMTVAQACAFVEDPFLEDAHDALDFYASLD